MAVCQCRIFLPIAYPPHSHSSSIRCDSSSGEVPYLQCLPCAVWRVNTKWQRKLTFIAAVMKYTSYLDVGGGSNGLMPAWRTHHSHTPLQCFPLYHFPPLYFSRSISHTCTKPNGVTTHHSHTHTCAHTHTFSPSVCAVARVSGTGSIWEQESEKESVSWFYGTEPHFLSSFSCCAVVYEMVSQHHAVSQWALPTIVTPITWCHLEKKIKLSVAGALWAKEAEDMCSAFSVISLHGYESSFQPRSLTTEYTFPHKC